MQERLLQRHHCSMWRMFRAALHGISNERPLQERQLVLHGCHVDQHNLLGHHASRPAIAIRARPPLLEIIQDAKDRRHLQSTGAA